MSFRQRMPRELGMTRGLSGGPATSEKRCKVSGNPDRRRSAARRATDAEQETRWLSRASARRQRHLSVKPHRDQRDRRWSLSPGALERAQYAIAAALRRRLRPLRSDIPRRRTPQMLAQPVPWRGVAVAEQLRR